MKSNILVLLACFSLVLCSTNIYSQLGTDDDRAYITEIYNENDTIYLFNLGNMELISKVPVRTPTGCDIVEGGAGGIATDPSTGDNWILFEMDDDFDCSTYDPDDCEGDRVLAKINLNTGVIDTNSIICATRDADPNTDYAISFQFTKSGRLLVLTYNDAYLLEIDKNTGAEIAMLCELEDYGPGNIILDPTDDGVIWHSDDDERLYKYDLNTCNEIDLDPGSSNNYIEMPDDFYNIMWYNNPLNGITGPAGFDDIDDPLYVYDINSNSIKTINLGSSEFDWYPRQNHLYLFVGTVTAIPTVGEWGLISLAILLMIIGTVAARTRQRSEL